MDGDAPVAAVNTTFATHDEYERRATSDAIGHQYDRHRNERAESDDGRNVADSRVFDAESALNLRQSKHHDGGAVARDE